MRHHSAPPPAPSRALTIEPWSGEPSCAADRLSEAAGFAWLDSALAMPRIGRWSVLVCEPRWRLVAHGRSIERHEAGGAVRRWDGDPFTALSAAIEAEPRVDVPRLDAADPGMQGTEALPFVGGAVGYLGFELARHVERLPATTRDDVGAPDLSIAWYDAALVWDGVRRCGWLVGTTRAVRALRARLDAPPLPAAFPPAAAAGSRGAAMQRGKGGVGDSAVLPSLRSNFEREEYLAAVARARRYIAAGDIYQVNLSQRFSVRTSTPSFELYRRLREVSPAPFAAYLDLGLDTDRGAGAMTLLSSSPERLLLLDGNELETRPIKGTRPRGASGVEDARLAAALRRSEKDAAEHVMIVDLERNDLGRIAEVGSVRVPEFAALESFAQVHHLTSTVTARRRAGVGLEATLRAIFPGGSVTGAPKVRALEIIDELEPTVRGAYTGAIGYISAHGRIDLNVAIRTITLVGDPAGRSACAEAHFHAGAEAHFHVGGAIVADSDPAAEYRETLDKARGMARALGVLLPDEAPSIVTPPLAAGVAAPPAAGIAAG